MQKSQHERALSNQVIILINQNNVTGGAIL